MCLIQFDDIRMVQIFEDLYLVLKHFQTRGWELFHLDYFYSARDFILASAFIDSAAIACADLVCEAIGVVCNGDLIIVEAVERGE